MTRICFLLLALLCLGADIAFGGDEPPPDLEAVLKAEPPDEAVDDEGGLSTEMRSSAMRAAALAFGSRAGLARRGWEIAAMLERHAPKLSAIYRFRDLMMEKDGFTVMPPVLAQTDRAFRLGRDSAKAATARRVLRIVEPERMVSAAPHWRDYLVRKWPEAELPASVLFPRSDAETARWGRWLREGWTQGTALADDIFAVDLDRLNRVFEGLVQWRRANLAGMVSAPSLETERVAVSGHGRLVRIGEIVARLGPPARFELRPGEWKPLTEGDTPSGGNTPSGGDTPSGGGTP
ncbi:MAG: type IV secretory system conjugative DNA transfer family protein [Alphaproteobacteria bacterium]|nr:type IV secretory system conjugative DNA transfer family protein [Alphaproteobacteria bacterium]